MHPIMYTRKQVESYGYKFTGITVLYGHHYELRNACIELNVTYDSINCFRIAEGQWEIYFKELVTTGFKDEALLP